MIDGNAVKPAHPTSSPVQSGEIAGDAIALRTPGLTRRFELIDSVYRLAEASHATGWVRLTYRNGLIERAASASATVDFRRRADGRIVSTQDALGRSATYAYGGAGRLASHNDLAGATWHYGYTAAGLVALTDPRGKTVLHATYDAAGRVSWIEVQGRKSAFSYSDKTTRAVDGLNRTTVFHHTKSGVTEAVESPAGTFSQLAFDAAGRPTAVVRDGANVATLSYYTEGTPASISAAGQTTHFAHDSHGLTRAAGAETARYGYDAAGRLSHATDAGGVRAYAYDAAGFPSQVDLGQWKTTLRHDAQGQTTELSRQGQTLVKYAYRTDGSVDSITHGGNGGTATFVYDRRGLRERASYGDKVNSAMRYDATGNLIHFLVDAPQGKRSQDYELGSYNEVLRIRNGGDAAGPDVTFRYDSAGNATAVEAGSRISTASYDALDRVARVTLDGETVVDYAYGTLDRDAVTAADQRTGETLAPFGQSAVFGTMDSVAYTRPRPATHTAVAYVPALKTFEATWRHLVPDALLLASLQRRNLPVRGETPDPAPFGHDKPSNSLFVPPEYRAVNCRVCTASIQSVTISAGRAVVGRSVTISITVAGACFSTDSESGPSGGIGSTLPKSWNHSLSYGDGNSTTFATPSANVRATHTYQAPGEHKVTDVVTCDCDSALALERGTTTVTVEDNCEGVTAITAPIPDPAPTDTANLTAATRTALYCLEAAVNNNGGDFSLESAYRSPSYQAHLREVWFKYQTVREWPESRCSVVRKNVVKEWMIHGLAYPPAPTSRHSSGIAFDAT